MPPGPLTLTPADVVDYDDVLWRVHRSVGAHALPWNQLRSYGPVSQMRWDPQPPGPPGQYPNHAVSYAATDLETAVAEVFQGPRAIDPQTGVPYATAWTPSRALFLLDLVNGSWLIRHDAAAALTSAPRPTCRRWAHEIHGQLGLIDGLWTPSTMTGRPMVVLFTRAADSFPPGPDFSRPLAGPGVWSLLSQIAGRYNWPITP